jgi:ADP-ribose pyrophosphatase YjhB (NUDIX family)
MAAAVSDISWSGPGGTFNLRAVAVICRGDEIQLCTVDGLGYWFLPGGRVRFGELGAAALARELAAELGHQLRVGDLAVVAENIFADDGIQHEIDLYYHVDWPSVLDPDDLRRGGELGHRFCWMGVHTLASVPFKPAGLIPVLQARPVTLKHVALDRSQPQ